MGIKYVLVDIDRTLFPSLEFAKGARLAALRAMRKEGMRAGILKAYGVLLKVVKEMGPNHHDHFGEMMRHLGEGRNSRAIAAGVYAYHEAKREIEPFPDARKALEALRRAGLKLYIASEGRAVKQWDKVLRMKLQKYFDGAFISEELGVEKSREFYVRIVRKLGVRADEILMIGDKKERDFEPARAAGLRAILIDRQGRGRKAAGVRNLVGAAVLARSMM